MCVQGRKHQMQKDTKTLMDAAKAASSLDTPMEGLITFEGAFKDEETEKVTIVLEYMNGGSLADIIKQVLLCCPPCALFCMLSDYATDKRSSLVCCRAAVPCACICLLGLGPPKFVWLMPPLCKRNQI